VGVDPDGRVIQWRAAQVGLFDPGAWIAGSPPGRSARGGHDVWMSQRLSPLV